MTPNLGPADRAIRFTVGYGLLFQIVWLFITGDLLFLGIAAVGLVLFATSLVGVCPLYLPLNLNTGAKPAGA